jgi:DNA-binding NarL/FixJ family response regulator
MSIIKIILADDHPLFAEGLAILLSGIEGIEITGTASNGEEALALLRTMPCHVAVLDMHMPVMDGIQTTRQIKKEFPEVRVLTLTMENEKTVVRKAIQAGVSGFVIKTAGKEELKEAILKVAAGESYFHESIKDIVEKQAAAPDQPLAQASLAGQLTSREIEILQLVAREFSNIQIGEKLFISPKTVETHRKNMMKKLGVKNTMGLVKFGLKNGLLDLKND